MIFCQVPIFGMNFLKTCRCYITWKTENCIKITQVNNHFVKTQKYQGPLSVGREHFTYSRGSPLVPKVHSLLQTLWFTDRNSLAIYKFGKIRCLYTTPCTQIFTYWKLCEVLHSAPYYSYSLPSSQLSSQVITK